jgi:hypothetical protein
MAGVCSDAPLARMAGVCSDATLARMAGVCSDATLARMAGVCSDAPLARMAGVCSGATLDRMAGVCSAATLDRMAGVCSDATLDRMAGVCSDATLARMAGVCSGATLDRITKLQQVIENAPKIESPYTKILDAITKGGGTLNMSNWHTCNTTHCLGGWTVHLAGMDGYDLEKRLCSTPAAAAIILRASRPKSPLPNFYARNEAALAFIKARAKEEVT